MSHSRSVAAAARPPVYGLAMYRELAAACMTVNVHVGIAGPHAANMRLFEATGVGTCLLTDAKSDLHEFFAPGEEVVAFEDAADAVAKAKELLAAPARMAEIGRRGQVRTLRDHGYEARVPTVIAAAEAALARHASGKARAA
jgi:spore maturation protein CgeB